MYRVLTARFGDCTADRKPQCCLRSPWRTCDVSQSRNQKDSSQGLQVRPVRASVGQRSRRSSTSLPEMWEPEVEWREETRPSVHCQANYAATYEGETMKSHRNFRIRTSSGRKLVPCVATCSKFFVITPSTEPDRGRYALTHTRSGFAAMFSNKHKPLRLMAGILGALPIPWGRIQSSRGLVKSWTALPIEIRRWKTLLGSSL